MKLPAESPGSDSLMDSVTVTNAKGYIMGIRYDRLVAILVGLVSSMFAGGLAVFISRVMHALFIDPLQGVANWSGEMVSGLTNAPSWIVSAMWAGVEGFISQFGPLAFGVGIGIAVLMLVIVGWEVTQA